MKIDNPLTGSISVGNTKTRTAKSKSSSSAAATVSSKDSVELTGASTQLNVLEDRLNQMDTSETDKLEAIRQALAEGSFQVNEEAVADALIQTSMDQIKRQGTR